MRKLSGGPCGPEAEKGKVLQMNEEMGGTEDIRSAPPEAMVCWCSGVTKADILHAVERGARTLADIKAATGACTLGRCRELSPRRR